MECFRVHQEADGCLQDIPENAAWHYCPKCGRRLAHIRIPPVQFLVNSNAAETRDIAVENVGLVTASVSFSLDGGVDGVALGRAREVIPPRGTATVEVELPPLSEDTTVGFLVAEITDCRHTDPVQDPWSPRSPLTVRAEVTAKVQRGADVRIVQEALFFHDGVGERALDVWNDGDLPTYITHIRCPSGYRCEGVCGEVNGGEPRSFVVRRDRAGVVEPRATLTVVLDGGTQHDVALFSLPTTEEAALPFAIIGVDFGTAFTSLAYRQGDTVDFLRPHGETSERFRTLIWVSKQAHEVTLFGPEAMRRYLSNQSDGYLFREIKTLLRMDGIGQGDNFSGIYPHKGEAAAIAMMRTRFGAEWALELVTQYLAWLRETLIVPRLIADFGTPNADVQFVFSLPVLDYATDRVLYTRQHENMQDCVNRAAFPVDRPGAVLYEMEPVCAALGLLHPRAGWPHLGTHTCPIEHGNPAPLFILDSGGGTTDVALGFLRRTGDQVKLDVEYCLGVDSQCRTFGGELVTTRVRDALGDMRTVDGEKNWFKGSLPTAGCELHEVFGDVPDIDVLGRAEDIKKSIAPKGAGGHEVDFTADHAVYAVTVLPELLHRIVGDHEAHLGEEINRRVLTDVLPQDVRYYLCVGGNTSIAAVEDMVGRFLGENPGGRANRKLRLPEADRTLAVAYGAAWVPTARVENAAPYTLRVLVPRRPTVLEVREATAGETRDGTLTPMVLAAETGGRVRLEAEYAGRSWCVGEVAITNRRAEYREAHVSADVQNGVVIVRHTRMPANGTQGGTKAGAPFRYTL